MTTVQIFGDSLCYWTSQDDWKLFKALHGLQKLKTISIKFCNCKATNLGVEKLIECFENIDTASIMFANSLQKLKTISNNCITTVDEFWKFENSIILDEESWDTVMIWRDYYELLNELHSSSTITPLTTSGPFLTLNFPSNLKEYTVDFSLGIKIRSVYSMYTNTGMSASLSSLAYLCRKSLMESLILKSDSYYRFALPPQMYCNFLSILNHSLECYSAMSRLDLSFFDFDPLRLRATL